MKIANVFGTIALAASLSGCAGLEQSRTFSPQEGDLVFQALSLEVDLVVGDLVVGASCLHRLRRRWKHSFHVP